MVYYADVGELPFLLLVRSSKFILSGLGIRTTTDVLRAAFAKFGNVVDGMFGFQINRNLVGLNILAWSVIRFFVLPFAAKVVIDRVSGISKGFGFVRYATLEEAEAGLRSMHRSVSRDNIRYFGNYNLTSVTDEDGMKGNGSNCNMLGN